jgi:hypothetical protein
VGYGLLYWVVVQYWSEICSLRVQCAAEVLTKGMCFRSVTFVASSTILNHDARTPLLTHVPTTVPTLVTASDRFPACTPRFPQDLTFTHRKLHEQLHTDHSGLGRKKARLDHFLAIGQRSAHATWPHTRCIDAMIINSKSEATWVAARATSSASQAILRQT